MIQQLRLFIYNPVLTFDDRDLRQHDREILAGMEGNFHCMYKLPNSLLPRLQSRVILSTKELAISTSKYDEGAVFSLEDLEKLKIQEGYLRAYTGDITLEIEIDNEDGESFAEIVIESWKDIKNEFDAGLSKQEEEHIDNQVKRLHEREKEQKEE